MPHHPLTNFEIRKYYQREAKFYGVYSRNYSPKIKGGDMWQILMSSNQQELIR